MIELGFNYRLPDILCSLGISQLNRLDKFVKKRRKIANIYLKSFENFNNIKTQKIDNNSLSSFHLFPILINFEKIKKTKKQLYEYFFKKKISLQSHYIPIYKHPYYKKIMNINVKDFRNSEIFFKRQISLPVFFDLELNQVRKVVSYLEKFMK